MKNLKIEDMNSFDKRRILEAFVENDDVLGLLLDFISNRHVQPNGEMGQMHDN